MPVCKRPGQTQGLGMSGAEEAHVVSRRRDTMGGREAAARALAGGLWVLVVEGRGCTWWKGGASQWRGG